MNQLIDFLSLNGSGKIVLLGGIIGYFLRMAEHGIWLRLQWLRDNKNIKPLSKLAVYEYLLNLPQALCIGVPLAFIIVAILAHFLPMGPFVYGCAWLVSIAISFLTIDLRDLIRRIQSIIPR